MADCVFLWNPLFDLFLIYFFHPPHPQTKQKRLKWENEKSSFFSLQSFLFYSFSSSYDSSSLHASLSLFVPKNIAPNLHHASYSAIFLPIFSLFLHLMPTSTSIPLCVSWSKWFLSIIFSKFHSFTEVENFFLSLSFHLSKLSIPHNFTQAFYIPYLSFSNYT